MNLSAPIPVLKQRAKSLSRQEGIPLHEALDRIAIQEGFGAWSLLAAKTETAPSKHIATLRAQLQAGDLVLLGARPRQGKTRLSLELALHTMHNGASTAFFTLDFTEANVADCFKALNANVGVSDWLLFDASDHVCADYIISKLGSVPAKTLVIIDYLQLLDQKRENPDLMSQVRQLKEFARQRQVIVLCLSQIDRRYDATQRPCPGVDDVRLPNPLDLSLFDKMCFLHRDTLQITSQSSSTA